MDTRHAPSGRRAACAEIGMPEYTVVFDGGPEHGHTMGLGEVLKGGIDRFFLEPVAAAEGGYLATGTTDIRGRWVFAWKLRTAAGHPHEPGCATRRGDGLLPVRMPRAGIDVTPDRRRAPPRR